MEPFSKPELETLRDILFHDDLSVPAKNAIVFSSVQKKVLDALEKLNHESQP